MLTLDDPQMIGDFAVFADEAEPRLVHVLPLSLSIARGQLTVMGQTGLWQITLAAPPRDAVQAALPGQRLLAAEALAEVVLTLIPGLTARQVLRDWRGGAVQFSGEVSPLAPLQQAWTQGLPDARLALTLTISGVEPAQRVTTRAAAVAPSGLTRLGVTHITRQTLTGTRSFARDLAVSLPT